MYKYIYIIHLYIYIYIYIYIYYIKRERQRKRHRQRQREITPLRIKHEALWILPNSDRNRDVIAYRKVQERHFCNLGTCLMMKLTKAVIS